MAQRDAGERLRNRRTLIVDPRIRRIGYAAFDAAILVDWGVGNFRSQTPDARVRRLLIPALVRMLDRFEPEVLLVPDVRAGAVRRSQHVRETIGAVVQEALRRGIVVHHVADAQVKHAFRHLNGRGPNKQKINQLIVEWFPELRPWLPRPRKLWEPEPYAVPLFTAIAMWCAWQGVPPLKRG